MRKLVLGGLFILALFGGLAISSAVTAEANPPFKTIVICFEGETIEVPLWQYNQGMFPGATEGPCDPSTTTTPPPTTTEPPPPTTTEPPPVCEDPPCTTGGTTGPPSDPPDGDLPETGAPWPIIGLFGFLLLSLGAIILKYGGSEDES